MKHLTYFFTGLCLVGLVLAQPQQASAQGNPPPLDPILDLAGSPINQGVYTAYSVDFIAAITGSTDITFAIRNDPGFTTLDDISVTDTTNPSGELLSDGSFASGLTPPWTYDNEFGATFPGVVSSGGCGIGPNTAAGDATDWCDGSVGSYDAIDQTVSTIAGDTYQITFNLGDGDATGNTPANFQQLCTNGADSAGPSTACNAVDTLVYAEAGLPASGNTPEPASIALFGSGLAALCTLRRYRKTKKA